MSSISYKDARRDPSLRLAFLGEIDLEDKTKYIESLYPSQTYAPDNCLMACTPRMSYGLTSIITIYPNAFETFQNMDEFLSALIDHEGKHAEDFFNDFNPDVRGLEIRAYQNQIDNFPRRPNCGEFFRNKTRENLELFTQMNPAEAMLLATREGFTI